MMIASCASKRSTGIADSPVIWNTPRLTVTRTRCGYLETTVAIDGGYAFFHRFPDRTIDEADLTARTPILADYIETVLGSHSVTRAPIAIGFSNGSIMGAALLLAHPNLLAGAILLRPLSPFSHDLPTRLDGTPVLIIDGEEDGRRS